MFDACSVIVALLLHAGLIIWRQPALALPESASMESHTEVELVAALPAAPPEQPPAAALLREPTPPNPTNSN